MNKTTVLIIIFCCISALNCESKKREKQKKIDKEESNSLTLQHDDDVLLENEKTESKESSSEFIDNEARILFIPTAEWQEIKPYHKLPAGLHIRMNLQTGVKEAKILSKEENESDKEISVPYEYSESAASGADQIQSTSDYTNEKQKILRKEILEALKNIKNEDPDKEKVSNDGDENVKRKPKKFRSYETLKAEFEGLHLNIESDSEILKRLITEYGETDDTIKINIIEDLDFLIHQIDNAVDFVNMDGIKKIIQPGLNSSNEEIRKGVMRLIGSASQSNPKVQIAAFEEGLLSQLLRIVARERDASISSKAVFAVSCLVRGFPYGQQKLIEGGGLHTLREVFLKQDWQSLTLQLKVVSLIQDLLEERANADGERAKQFGNLDLMNSLVDGEWCSAIASLLTGVSFDKRGRREDLSAALSKEIPLRPDHDMVDKVVNTMSLLAPSCHDNFFPVLPLLQSLKETYSDLAYKEKHQGEDGYEFFQELANQIQSLLRKLSLKDEL